MKLAKWRLSAAVVLIFLAGARSPAQEKKIVVGILPTYDTSGESYGPAVSQMLTGMLYQQFAVDPRFKPVYLNPGGLYDPGSTSWVAEYIQSVGTPFDLVLATTFTQPETPKHGDLILHLKAVQLDIKTGDPQQTWTSNTPLKERNALLDYTQSYISTGYFDTKLIYQPSRNFDKQPLGKASFELAKQSATLVGQSAAKLTASGAAPAISSSNSCKMRLKINYEERHSISKSYTCIIDEREESLGIKEGILEVEEKARPLLIQIKLNDAPYKLPKQDLYLFDPVLDCSRPGDLLNVSIGPAGEAHFAWQ